MVAGFDTAVKVLEGWRKEGGADARVNSSKFFRNVDLPLRTEEDGPVGSQAGNSFHCWSQRDWVSDDDEVFHPGNVLGRFGALNDCAMAYMRTLEWVSRSAENAERVELSLLLATMRIYLHFARDPRTDLREASNVISAAIGRATLGPKGIRPARHALPGVPRSEILAEGEQAIDVGRRMRNWFERSREKIIALRVRPVVAHRTEHAVQRFAIESRIPIMLSGEKVEEIRTSRWASLSRGELERYVWSAPRTRLAEFFGVSDMGISKKCRKFAISQPPRGFWQHIKTQPDDPMGFLNERGVEPPEWWSPSIAASQSRSIEDIIERGVNSRIKAFTEKERVLEKSGEEFRARIA